MKYQWSQFDTIVVESPPARGALVEMILAMKNALLDFMSPPARGALVEIPPCSCGWSGYKVAPRKGGVG